MKGYWTENTVWNISIYFRRCFKCSGVASRPHHYRGHTQLQRMRADYPSTGKPLPLCPSSFWYSSCHIGLRICMLVPSLLVLVQCTHQELHRASLVAQWIRICLPMQRTQFRSLVLEDPTCRRATKPVCHNYWAYVPQLLKPACLKPVLHNKRSHHNEKPAHRNKE